MLNLNIRPLLLILLLAPFTRADEPYSDPLTPQDLPRLPEKQWPGLFQIPEELRGTASEIERLERQLAKLPPLQDTRSFQAYGYHSDYLPVEENQPGAPRWTIDLHWVGAPNVEDQAFVMVPARDYRSEAPQAYAFPKRFRLRAFQEGGSEVLLDWTEEDFPDPELRPVYFRLPEIVSSHWRLEVFAGVQERNLEYFALGRVYIICFGEPWNVHQIKASSSYESPPYWSIPYLTDEEYTLGLPLGDRSSDEGDFYLPLQKGRMQKSVIIEIEFPSTVKAGWLNLLPAQAPGRISVPGYGFPRSLQIERVRRQGQDVAVTRWFDLESTNPGDNLVRKRGLGLTLDALRFECSDFPSYAGEAAFALGEIQLTHRAKVIAPQEPPVVLVNGKPVELDTTPLVDGITHGRKIIGIGEWLQGLAAAKPLERQLSLARKEEQRLKARLERVQTNIVVVLISLLTITLGILATAYWIGRRRSLLRLRNQIRSDLHDDVGSKVAAIGLASTFVQAYAAEPAVKERASRIRAIADRMHQGLRDVLWMTDGRSDTVEAVIRKLGDSARQLVGEEQLILHCPPWRELSRRKVRLETKRDLLFFFKEALHNASAHAAAENIEVTIAWAQRILTVTVRDDGIGFVMPATNDHAGGSHLGLRTMQERARRLHGELIIRSNPGAGTTVRLQVRL